MPGGAGAGFIANNISGGSSYTWNAGTAYSSYTGSNQTVATGTYRVRIERAGSGPSDADPVSGWFTLLPAPLVLTSVMPTTMTADAKSSSVMYGSGFNSSSVVYFDYQYGQTAPISYISPDGTRHRLYHTDHHRHRQPYRPCRQYPEQYRLQQHRRLRQCTGGALKKLRRYPFISTFSNCENVPLDGSTTTKKTLDSQLDFFVFWMVRKA